MFLEQLFPYFDAVLINDVYPVLVLVFLKDQPARADVFEVFHCGKPDFGEGFTEYKPVIVAVQPRMFQRFVDTPDRFA